MTMLQVKELNNNITQVKIIGRLDIQGTGYIETLFTAHTASKKAKVIVDLSEVNFISSIGIRLLLTTSKAQLRRGGKIVLLNATELVEDALLTAGINLLIPMYKDFHLAFDDVDSIIL